MDKGWSGCLVKYYNGNEDECNYDGLKGFLMNCLVRFYMNKLVFYLLVY